MLEKEEQELLKIPEVVEEIKRHLWIESEKAGYDIGFDKAAEDWMKRFAKAWVEYHMPWKNSAQTKKRPAKVSGNHTKKRRANSYTNY